MGQTIGELLPLALGVAISPVPIIAVILMLIAPHARKVSLWFLGGWLGGILGVTLLFVWWSAITGADSHSPDDPSTAVSWILLLLGAGMLFLSARQWHDRPGAEHEAHLPAWLSAIEKVSLQKAAGLGLALSALNPKNLALCIAAGVTISSGGLSGWEGTLTIVIFAILAVCTVAAPIVAFAIDEERMRGPLDRLKVWLEDNNAIVMSVLLLVIGVVLLGRGLGGLT